MTYQTLLHELAPDLNPAGGEVRAGSENDPGDRFPGDWMRLHYGSLNHLPRETFVTEAKLAADLEGQSPGILQKIAESMGMATDFAKWEASHAA